MMQVGQGSKKWRIRLPLAVGGIAVVLLFGVIGVWGFGAVIAGAVVASGTIETETDLQVVQHQDGGVVGEILARDGDRVEAGEIVLTLDPTFLKSERAIVERQIFEIYARKARLRAERDRSDVVQLSILHDGFALDPVWVNAQVEGQKNLFEARRELLRREAEQLREQKTQVNREIEGFKAQMSATTEQLQLVDDELEDQTELFSRGVVANRRLIQLKRDRARFKGELSRLEAEIAESRAEIAEIEVEIVQLEGRYRESAISQLRDLRYAEIELEERRLSLLERISRLEIRAPASGKVFDSDVFAVGAVILPAEPIMYIVPDDQPLLVKTQIDPIHVEQIYVGQVASLRFTSFNHRTTPQIPGTIIQVSADAIVDPETNSRYYEAFVRPNPEAVADVASLEIIPGMPVEAFLKTVDRRPIEYLMQPLTDYFNRAFRE